MIASMFTRGLAVALTFALVGLTPATVRAQDDDMPDGDVDIVEKPKPKPKKEKKAEKKKEEPKKEEPKPEPKPEPKEEPKPEPKPEKPKKEPKPKPSDDDDILTDNGSAAAIGGAAAATPPPGGVPVAPVGDGTEGTGRVILTDDVPPTGAPVDEPPVPHSRIDGDDAAVGAAPVGGIDGDEPPAGSADGTPGDVKTIETKAVEPDEDPGAGYTPWIVAGAAGGGLVLLAGAGVGGFLLVNALTATPSGTVTVSVH